jgi:hypothetical protein
MSTLPKIHVSNLIETHFILLQSLLSVKKKVIIRIKETRLKHFNAENTSTVSFESEV